MSASKTNPASFTTSSVSLNALRAFEAAARHLSFTRAGLELSVTQAAVSHQVRALEERLGVRLFRRVPRGLVLTDDGEALLPPLREAFARLARVLEQFEGGRIVETLNVGTDDSFAVWLLARLSLFAGKFPGIGLKVVANDDRGDMPNRALDYSIRFGDGSWPGIHAERIGSALFAPLCSPSTAAGLGGMDELDGRTLYRSARPGEWPAWFAAARVAPVLARGPQFSSSRTMAEAALRSDGIALLPIQMFDDEIASGRLVQPFEPAVDLGAYWLARPASRAPSAAMLAFHDWLLAAASTPRLLAEA